MDSLLEQESFRSILDAIHDDAGKRVGDKAEPITPKKES